MNISIPFNKTIPFKTSIAEVCSISLEHDVSINEKELLGDFIITGEYKNLDINVDSMPFEHVIPFSVTLDNDIIIDTLNYEVEDFSYEIINNDSLSINIVLHVSADKEVVSNKEVIFEKEDIDEDARLDIIEDSNIEENKNDLNINVINNANIKEDYITYHIHLVKPNESIDNISSLYNIDKDKLLELNDITTISVGDKIIIPELNE